MKHIKNGGLGECIVLKESNNLMLVAVLNDVTANFAVVEDFNAEWQSWSKAGYYGKLDTAIDDYNFRYKKMENSKRSVME